ncbi:hypothetical protein ABPG77_005127 [Micractinium sp. CCAP 211/92]
MGRLDQRTAAVGAAGGGEAAPRAGGGKRRICLRLEYISDSQTRAVLVSMRLASIVAWVLLLWELSVQTHDDSNSLLRTHVLEWVNIGVGAICLPAMLLTCACFGRRVWAAARSVRQGGARPLSPRKRCTLGLTCAELVLHTLNLGCYLAMNIYSIEVPCGWFNVPVDALALISLTIWNTIFCLNLCRPLVLLPSGSWRRARERWAARGSICRWLATACCSSSCCCYCCCDAAGCGAMAAAPRGLARGKEDEDMEFDPEQPPLPPALAMDRSFSLAPVSRDDKQMAVCVSVGMMLTIWVPTEALVVTAALGSMGFVKGADNIALCPSGSSNPKDCVLVNDLPDKPHSQGCASLDWSCDSTPVFTGLSVALGGMFTASLVLFAVLITFVLAEYRRLPYTPFRVLNVAARLFLRTRMFTSLFFLISIVLIFYLDIHSCNANLEYWLGLGPMMIKMSILLVVEAYLYSPSPPHGGALKLHTALQQFAWLEAAAPTMQRRRGLPGEPLFCFETMIKTCYFALHTYRHFRPESTISNLHTALALYGCTHHEWLREPTHDMNCLLAWGPRALVITFRGTQSLANIKSDAQVWRSVHPPRRGVYLLGTQPMVHTGFLASWMRRGLDRQVLQRVQQVLQGLSHRDDMPPFDTTVVRCCSTLDEDSSHEEKNAAAAAEAAAALQAEAATAGGGASGYGSSQELSGLDEAALAAVLAELAGPGSGRSQASLASNGSAGTTTAPAGAEQQQQQQPQQQQQQQGPFRIIVTGHSLGGAVATLCAMDLARELPNWGFAPLASPDVVEPQAAGTEAAGAGMDGSHAAGAEARTGGSQAAVYGPAGAALNGAGHTAQAPAAPSAKAAGGPAGSAEAVAAAAAAAEAGGSDATPAAARPVWLSVYTFGAPRTGNHAFARDYGSLVPDSWSVINDQDLVAKSAKFVVLFKRPGNVVIVNPRGDLIVNPSFLEHSVQRSFSSSVKQHLLISYNQSFAAVLRAQHAGKGLSGGHQALALLAASPAVRELLVKPLAIRHASLKRFIYASGASGTAGAGQTARPSPFVVPSEQALISDLSGDMLEAAAEALEAAGHAQQAGQLRSLQPSPSTVAKAVLTDTLDTFLF